MINLSSATLSIDGDEIMCSTYLQSFGGFEAYYIGEIVVNDKTLVLMRETSRISLYRALYEGHKISKLKLNQPVIFKNKESQVNLPICIN